MYALQKTDSAPSIKYSSTSKSGQHPNLPSKVVHTCLVSRETISFDQNSYDLIISLLQ